MFSVPLDELYDKNVLLKLAHCQQNDIDDCELIDMVLAQKYDVSAITNQYVEVIRVAIK